MADTKKSRSQTLNKIYIIGGTIFAVALTIAGIIAINQSKEKGTDEVLASESELIDAIYSNSTEEAQPLTDDQFYAALSRIFPNDNTTDADIRNTIYTIENTLFGAGIRAEINYFNNYGEPGYRITTSTSINEILPLLDYSFCREYHVEVTNIEETSLLGVYEVTSEGVTIRLEQGMDLGTPENVETIADLSVNLQEQYGIDKITLTDKALLIYSYGLSTADLINAFDYIYQWCLQNDCDRQIFIYASDSLVIATNPTLADDFYRSNYPVQDLAATFRLYYYTAECFFNVTIQRACNIYL